MKRLLAAFMALAMLTTMAVTAFAADDDESWDLLDPASGPYIVLGFVDKNGESVDHYEWSSNDYKVSGSYSRGGTYVSKPYFEDGSICIKAEVNASQTSEKEVVGKVTVTETSGDRARYTAEIRLYVLPPAEMRVREYESKIFSLPGGYHDGVVKFKSEEEGNTVGTLEAEFVEYGGSDTVAYFKTRVIDQKALLLSHNSKPDTTILRKYEDADLQFLTWDASPKFDSTGTLGIIMEKGDYLYQVGGESKLTAVSGKYNEDRGTYDFQTSTLGKYVISDIKLSGAGTAASESTAAPVSSTAPPPASSVAPPPASSVAPPPASSSKPAPSSSAAPPPPESSSVESSEESSSESEAVPEVSQPDVSEPESSEAEAKPEPEEDEGGFPILPVAIGAGVVLVGGVAAYFIFGNKGGKGSKNYDSWDD